MGCVRMLGQKLFIPLRPSLQERSYTALRLPQGHLYGVSEMGSATIRMPFGRRAKTRNAAVVNTPFIPPTAISGLNDSPLCAYVERYVTLLAKEGYSSITLVSHVYLFCRFHQWLQRRRRSLHQINETLLDEFLAWRRPRDSHDGAPQPLRRLLAILRSAGVAPAGRAHLPDTRTEQSFVRGHASGQGVAC